MRALRYPAVVAACLAVACSDQSTPAAEEIAGSSGANGAAGTAGAMGAAGAAGVTGSAGSAGSRPPEPAGGAPAHDAGLHRDAGSDDPVGADAAIDAGGDEPGAQRPLMVTASRERHEHTFKPSEADADVDPATTFSDGEQVAILDARAEHREHEAPSLSNVVTVYFR